MLKVTPPKIEQQIKHAHTAYLVGIREFGDQPEVLQSVDTPRNARALAERLNKHVAQGDAQYPRFVGIPQDGTYFDPDCEPPARLPVINEIGPYLGPFPLVVVVA